jgi:DNA-binding response OmpR family regulator
MNSCAASARICPAAWCLIFGGSVLEFEPGARDALPGSRRAHAWYERTRTPASDGWGQLAHTEFLTNRPQKAPSCLVLDIQLPGISGLDLQQELADGDAQIPIIFMTGYGDIPTTVRAMKAGAIEFLTKPFRDDDLLSAVDQAIKRSDQIEQLKKTPRQKMRRREREKFLLSSRRPLENQRC